MPWVIPSESSRYKWVKFHTYPKAFQHGEISGKAEKSESLAGAREFFVELPEAIVAGKILGQK